MRCYKIEEGSFIEEALGGVGHISSDSITFCLVVEKLGLNKAPEGGQRYERPGLLLWGFRSFVHLNNLFHRGLEPSHRHGKDLE